MIFSNLLGGLSGDLLGYFWSPGGQFGLKSSSIRLHVNFPLRPKSTSDSFCWRSGSSMSQKMQKKPRIIDASTLKTPFFAIEDGGFQDGHPHGRRSARLQAGKPSITPRQAQRYTLTSGNLPTTWVPPPKIKKARGCNCKFSRR